MKTLFSFEFEKIAMAIIRNELYTIRHSFIRGKYTITLSQPKVQKSVCCGNKKCLISVNFETFLKTTFVSHRNQPVFLSLFPTEWI
jgi:aspartate carbamoyltransferase regulatory subunit